MAQEKGERKMNYRMNREFEIGARALLGSWRQARYLAYGDRAQCVCGISQGENYSSYTGYTIPMDLFSSSKGVLGWIGKCPGCETLYWREK